jgi:putative ABC transport system permease protein
MSTGARGIDILMQFLIDPVVISIIGGIIGGLLGVSVSEIISYFLK